MGRDRVLQMSRDSQGACAAIYKKIPLWKTVGDFSWESQVTISNGRPWALLKTKAQKPAWLKHSVTRRSLSEPQASIWSISFVYVLPKQALEYLLWFAPFSILKVGEREVRGKKTSWEVWISWGLGNCSLSTLWVGAFPGRPVVKNLHASAGDMGLIPGLGKIPHAMEQLRLWATTMELVF